MKQIHKLLIAGAFAIWAWTLVEVVQIKVEVVRLSTELHMHIQQATDTPTRDTSTASKPST